MHTDNHRMSNHAKLTNGHWTLPRHANGVLREEDIRVPGGERGLVQGHISASGEALMLKDQAEPEKGWTLR